MSRPSSVRKPTATELRRVRRRLEKPLLPWQRRRAEVLLLHAAGQTATRIAQLLQVHPNTVYADRRAFARHRLSCLNGPRAVGAPPRLSREQIEAIGHLAGKPPTAVGLPYGRWSLAKLRAYLIRKRLVKAISREHLRRVLKKGDTACAAFGASSSAPTPTDRPVILHRLRAWWRHRPRRAILAFFDVQPITVKAYGGRRYTRQKRLVLARNQKTRGRFYLFLLYEVNRGLVRWAFYPGKGAVYICRFLRRVRRWYPRRRVRIALDRDPAHPIKARATRSLMRRLGLNWTSLPKRSADDNPAETTFSDIPQSILDNSDDPDERTTRGRISRHLRARNRRPDRFVRIGYLRDTHRK